MADHVFAGITLNSTEVLEIHPQAIVHPPVERGQVLSLLPEQPERILIIDGNVYPKMAVTHKELLLALHQGVKLFGCSAIGALRAVELNRFGMNGRGRIYRCLARGEVMADDEVLAPPAIQGCNEDPQSVTLIDLRLLLTYDLDLGTGQEIRNKFLCKVKKLHFSMRTIERILAAAQASGFEQTALGGLERFFSDRTKRASHADAVEALGELAKNESASQKDEEVPSGLLDWTPSRTGYLDHFRSFFTRYTDKVDEPSPGQVFSLAQLHHPDIKEFITETARRFMQASQAQAIGLDPPNWPPPSSRFWTGYLAKHLPDAHQRCLGPLDLCEELKVHRSAQTVLNQSQKPEEDILNRFGHAWEDEDLIVDDYVHKRAVNLVLRQGDLIPIWAFIRCFKFIAGFKACRLAAREAMRLRANILQTRPELGRGRPVNERVAELYGRFWGATERKQLLQAARSRGMASLESLIETASFFFLPDILLNKEAPEAMPYRTALAELKRSDLSFCLDAFSIP